MQNFLYSVLFQNKHQLVIFKLYIHFTVHRNRFLFNITNQTH